MVLIKCWRPCLADGVHIWYYYYYWSYSSNYLKTEWLLGSRWAGKTAGNAGGLLHHLALGCSPYFWTPLGLCLCCLPSWSPNLFQACSLQDPGQTSGLSWNPSGPLSPPIGLVGPSPSSPSTFHVHCEPFHSWLLVCIHQPPHWRQQTWMCVLTPSSLGVRRWATTYPPPPCLCKCVQPPGRVCRDCVWAITEPLPSLPSHLGLPDLTRAHTRWLLSILPLYPLGFWDPSQGLKHEEWIIFIFFSLLPSFHVFILLYVCA